MLGVDRTLLRQAGVIYGLRVRQAPTGPRTAQSTGGSIIPKSADFAGHSALSPGAS